MSTSKIEENLQGVLNNFTPQTFIYDLLCAYGKPKATIIRLQKGDYNSSKNKDEILWKKNLFFKKVNKTELQVTFDKAYRDEKIIKHDPRFIIVSDYQTVLAFDTKTTDKLNIPIADLVENENFHFFLPLAGKEKITYYKENAADIEAAEYMAKIYDEICKNNPDIKLNSDDIQGLNVFLSRLLFCFFAESTLIFKQNLFIESIESRTKEDGSDLDQYFEALFRLLNTSEKKRVGYPKYLNAFPYVNGGLFKQKYKTPQFSRKLRKMIIECAGMDWSVINPDIFGSMIQAVADPLQRSNLGMHYTSVPNIMKVIQPLFLDELYQGLEKFKENKNKLNELYKRLSTIKFFDPACGSGNFLIIAYKELRKFEMQLLKRLEELGKHPTFFSQVHLSQFYGIEIDSFACELGKLSLWLAEHQMNIEFKRNFGKTGPSLPLKEGGHIICGNATRLNWEEVCPKEKKSEVYLLGNPPYLGARNQNNDQKSDVKHVLGTISGHNNLDYIACWYFKGADYIRNSTAKCAFVTTNSIFQGSQVSILWSHILNKGIEIEFAYRSFKWKNSAKNKASVICAIVGLRRISNKPKFIYHNDIKIRAKNINAYLREANNIFIDSRKNSVANLPRMSFGSMPNDGGHLILNSIEYAELIKSIPESKKFIRKAIGAKEYLNGIKRYCIWIDDDDLNEANKIPNIKNRIEKVKKYRTRSKRKVTQELSKFAHKFGEIRHLDGISIVIPRVSSERREYIPFEYANEKSIILDSAQALYNVEPYVFGIISSRMHMVWIKAVSGRLKSDYRYSASLSYNTFPLLEINKKQKEQIHFHVLNVLSERAKYPGKTIAELYDPKKMPTGLREAHCNLDAAVERCYQSKPFENDEQRLDHLFKLYEDMIQNEKKGKKSA